MLSVLLNSEFNFMSKKIFLVQLYNPQGNFLPNLKLTALEGSQSGHFLWVQINIFVFSLATQKHP